MASNELTNNGERENERASEPATPDAKESKKPEVIEILFNRLWPAAKPRPKGPMIVRQEDVISAINERNLRYPNEKDPLSPRNAANFLKDFIRHKTCNDLWPERLKAERITARQRYGEKQVLEFVDYRLGDKVAFEDRYEPTSDMRVLPVEALSVPREARALGREDEPWLIQVIVDQRIIHTHLAVVAADAGLHVVTLAHLQTSVKTQPEIDATFIAVIRNRTTEGTEEEIRAYVTGEAKQIGERILEDQLREQVNRAFAITAELTERDAIHAVMPMAFKVIRYPVDGPPTHRGIYVAQFAPIMRDKFEREYRGANLHEMPLTLQSRAFYVPHPPIRGISYKKIPKTKIAKKVTRALRKTG